MQLFQGVKAKDIARYALLPGIIPRIRAFFASGFGWLAFMMAVVYNSVRLLPNGHPYLSPQNMGKFGIRHVIAEAANNLVISRRNIDQLIIFIALLVGMVLLALQIAGVLFALVVQPAAAGGLSTFVGLFETRDCTAKGQNDDCIDIAFMLMDKVFGVPNLFNSKFAPSGTDFGSIPVFNRAMQELFQYYSYAMLVVGLVIFLYYVVVIVGETANTGTPFGRRFNHIYAPLRLVGAIGLLVPLNYGLNGAQYITLLAAKYGSGFATNGWVIFNNELEAAETPIGTRQETLIARPKPADLTNIVAFMSIAATCREAYKVLSHAGDNKRDIQAYIAKNEQPAEGGGGGGGENSGVQSEPISDYKTALTFFNNRDIIITFGHKYTGEEGENMPDANVIGDVDPLCGQITVHTNVAGVEGGGPPNDQRKGPYLIQQAYFDVIKGLWENDNLEQFGQRLVAIHVGIPEDPCSVGGDLPGDCKLPPDAAFKQTVVNDIQQVYDGKLVAAYNEITKLDGGFYDIPDELLKRGWGGAAIWYNHIAEWNGALFAAAINAPTPSVMPKVMKNIEEERRKNDNAVDTELRYEPYIASVTPVSTTQENDLKVVKALYGAYSYWMSDGRGLSTDQQTSGNVFFDLLNAIFGIGGLFTMRENDDIHPLAQLSALGKSIIESAVRNLLTALVFSAGGGMGEILGTHLGAALNSISSMFVAFTTIGLSIGFMLYYVLPFMPFMYFFFAVSSWVKTIFEAMVGVPLWALAHLKIDGNGFPGDQASNGYFLIFEIFVRPILTVFGLISAMAIFAAMARTLNGIFDLVVENLTGFDCAGCDTSTVAGIEYKRSAIDEFFFTIIYTILIYMLATSSFKMIDQIPHGILRWIGAGVQSFGDQHDDPAQGMVQYAAIGGSQMAGQVTSALQQGARTVGQAVGLPFGLMARAMQPKVGISGNSTKPAGLEASGGVPPPSITPSKTPPGHEMG